MNGVYWILGDYYWKKKENVLLRLSSGPKSLLQKLQKIKILIN